MSKKISFHDVLSIGLMLFALFFGAGNLIFPTALGQAAGSNIWPAVIGFLITGVGLPLLGVLAIGIAGSVDSQGIAGKVHPVFAVFLMVSIYLTIGPLFAIPRTGAVAFEIGVLPFLPNDGSLNKIGLFLHTLVFFGITYFLSLNPTKLVDRIGKILTPALLITLGVILIQPILKPMGTFTLPAVEYAMNPFFKGFKEGYLTMDTLASVVFGIVVINAIKDKGVTQGKEIAKVCAGAGLIASGCLVIIYVALAYLGATSVEVVGKAANGGGILASVANHYLGSGGNLILGLTIVFACLTTSVGLVSSCATYFMKMFPKFTYQQLVGGFTLFSLFVANIGLSQLISFSVPVLVALYPVVMVLIILVFFESWISERKEVYRCSIFLTGIISLTDGLQAAGIELPIIYNWLAKFIPLYDVGFGWVVPALFGVMGGYVVNYMRSGKILLSSRI